MNQEKIKLNKKKAVFLDRDGVINKDLGYVCSIEKFIWIEGALDSIEYLKKNDFLVIVISNQSGVSRGFFAEEEVKEFHKWINSQLFLKKKVTIDDFFFCTDLPGTPYSKRKPSPGMINDAIKKYNIDKHKSFLIGDKRTDVLAAKNANLRGYLFRGGNLFIKIREILRIF